MAEAQGKRGRGRPRSERADGAILQAAFELLSERGYARMSMDEVAARAGVTKPTVYLRYRGKADVAAAALAAHDPGDLPPETGDVRADLIAHLRHLRRGIEGSGGLAMVGNVLAEEGHTPQLLEQFRARVLAPRRMELQGILERARDRGDVGAGVDLTVAAHMLIGAYYAQYLSGEPFPLRWPEQQVDLVLAGAGASPAGGESPGALFGGRARSTRKTRRGAAT